MQEENLRPRLRYLSQAQIQAPAQDEEDEPQEPPQPEYASHDIFLDEDELFTQLCTVANLVKVSPQKGLFLSHVDISEGVIRVWRNWLATQAASILARRGSEGASEEPPNDIVLWVDEYTWNVGLRFRVHERQPAHGIPVMVGTDEDVAVSYRLEYEELLVRTNQLLLTVEESEVQEVTTSGKSHRDCVYPVTFGPFTKHPFESALAGTPETASGDLRCKQNGIVACDRNKPVR